MRTHKKDDEEALLEAAPRSDDPARPMGMFDRFIDKNVDKVLNKLGAATLASFKDPYMPGVMQRAIDSVHEEVWDDVEEEIKGAEQQTPRREEGLAGLRQNRRAGSSAGHIYLFKTALADQPRASMCVKPAPFGGLDTNLGNGQLVDLSNCLGTSTSSTSSHGNKKATWAPQEWRDKAYASQEVVPVNRLDDVLLR